ncbi:hypothetical protein JOM56_009949 [Amanita muscaria]
MVGAGSGTGEREQARLGGNIRREREGEERNEAGFTIVTNTKPDMKIARDEIFGLVGIVLKSEYEEGVIHGANDTMCCMTSDSEKYKSLHPSIRLCSQWFKHQPSCQITDKSIIGFTTKFHTGIKGRHSNLEHHCQ